MKPSNDPLAKVIVDKLNNVDCVLYKPAKALSLHLNAWADNPELTATPDESRMLVENLDKAVKEYEKQHSI